MNTSVRGHRTLTFTIIMIISLVFRQNEDMDKWTVDFNIISGDLSMKLCMFSRNVMSFILKSPFPYPNIILNTLS